MVRGLAESSGTVVPPLAMLKRSPPLLGPDSGRDIAAVRNRFDSTLRGEYDRLLSGQVKLFFGQLLVGSLAFFL
jgi:hypothetical protein